VRGAAEPPSFLAGGGEVGALMRSHDWLGSPLGPPAGWPQSLRSVVGLVLGSKFPMFVAWGPELGFLYNDPYAEILGAKHPASLGARFHDIWSEIWPDISPLIDAAMAGEATYRQDLPLLMNRKGYDEQTWFTFSYSPVRDESGEVAGMFCAVAETTEAHKAQDALRKSEALYRGLFTAIEAGFCIIEVLFDEAGQPQDFRYIETNPAFERQAGFSKVVGRDVVGCRVRQFVPQLEQLWFDAFGSVALTGEPTRFEEGSGSLDRWWDVYAFRVGEPGQNRVAVLFNDISQRRRAELALKDLNETLEKRVDDALAERRLLADVVESTDALVQVVDTDLRWLAVNKAAADEFERIYGVMPKVGESMFDLFGHLPEHRSLVRSAWERALAGEAFTETAELGDPARDRRFYEMKYDALRDLEGRITGAYQIVYDVTDLLRDQARLRTIFETSHQFQGLISLDGILGEANATSLAAINARAEDVVGKLYWETPWFRATPGMSEKIRKGFLSVVQQGRAFREEVSLNLPSGRRVFDVSMRPIRNELGDVVAVMPEAVEITDRRNAEDALRQSQKLESMGQLTGGVAHDFNNLLTPIIGSLDMLYRTSVGGEREQRLIVGALQSAERAKTLVQRLLAFARRQPLQASAVDMTRLVRNMGDLISSTMGPQIRVVAEAEPGLAAAKADANQLEMAILNLAVNARDAMPDGGLLRITAAEEAIGPGHRSQLPPGSYIRLSVADTGVGMDRATAARAIEPFFSTKGVGRGTGLGLSMVHGLAIQLGGALTIRSRRGAGTNVELWLPITAHAVEDDDADAHHAPATAHGAVLLVDDEDLVRLSTADMLTELGYIVLEARSAEEALEMIEGGLRPDLLITDHLMPGMSGTELARAVREQFPSTKVLVVSGYADTEGIAPDLPRLTKPFRNADLAASLAGLTGGMH
jgi:signal transduction histidine kinase